MVAAPKFILEDKNMRKDIEEFINTCSIKAGLSLQKIAYAVDDSTLADISDYLKSVEDTLVALMNKLEEVTKDG